MFHDQLSNTTLKISHTHAHTQRERENYALVDLSKHTGGFYVRIHIDVVYTCTRKIKPSAV